MGAEDDRRRSPVRFVLYLALAGVVWCLVALLVSFLPVHQEPPLPDLVGFAFPPAVLLCVACLVVTAYRADSRPVPWRDLPAHEEDRPAGDRVLGPAVAGLPLIWKVAAGTVLLAALVLFVIALATPSTGTSGVENGQYVLWVGRDRAIPVTWERYLSARRQETWLAVGPTLATYVVAAMLAAGLARRDPAEVRQEMARTIWGTDPGSVGSDGYVARPGVRLWKFDGREPRP